MKELLEFIAKSMVTDPESVQVEVVEKENHYSYETPCR